MYNKLFTKILDSSIWLEPTPTRLLWMVFIAAMDEDGMCHFASVPNLAHRARLTIEETEEGLKALEGPDPNSSDPEHEGRRIERVQGGWIVLNAEKYRSMITKVVARERTRVRVARHRAKVAGCNAPVTLCNGALPSGNDSFSAHDSDTASALVGVEEVPEKKGARWFPEGFSDDFRKLFTEWEEHVRDQRNGIAMSGATRKAQLSQCSREGEDRSTKVVREAIIKGWKSLVWDFDTQSHSKSPTRRTEAQRDHENTGLKSDIKLPKL